MEKTLVNGIEIYHQDIIFHTTITKLSFMDTIRVLFGKKIHVKSRIFTDNENIIIVGSDITEFVENIIPKKEKGWLYVDKGDVK